MSGDEQVTVVVGGLEPLLDAGLRCLLAQESGMRLLASGVDVGGLAGVVLSERPGVVIVGETVSYDILSALKAVESVAGVVVVAGSAAAACGTTLRAAGFTCLASSVSVVELFSAIRVAATGEATFDGVSGARVVALQGRGGLLTERELEVFQYLRQGIPYARIGESLYITPETARSHAANICRKLGVTGKQKLIGMSLWEN